MISVTQQRWWMRETCWHKELLQNKSASFRIFSWSRWLEIVRNVSFHTQLEDRYKCWWCFNLTKLNTTSALIYNFLHLPVLLSISSYSSLGPVVLLSLLFFVKYGLIMWAFLVSVWQHIWTMWFYCLYLHCEEENVYCTVIVKWRPRSHSVVM